MLEPMDISPAMQAFPAGVVREGYLPLEKDIPDEFKKTVHDNKWIRLFNEIFFRTGDRDIFKLELFPKEGIDAGKAWAHICACMGSYEPRHEHKTAGVAYLFSLWFDDWRWEKRGDVGNIPSNIIEET